LSGTKFACEQPKTVGATVEMEMRVDNQVDARRVPVDRFEPSADLSDANAERSGEQRESGEIDAYAVARSRISKPRSPEP
jgi:hypothetical protein